MNEPEPRLHLIARIRAQIRAGTYVTEGKLREVARRVLEAHEQEARVRRRAPVLDPDDLGRFPGLPER